ncbi:AcvB/VirJ family lysyl-phosphatidylglycerol hydrolase [Desertivirga brevis]|uniref:AcvB/VirJ family lysyl-phosphatidylglycerol hydrolase n=1 Tax=Desertivirga brevis TaxID=2810310 RepID=UPI001A969E39|nr:AcvB/VirJ family lysyl-phosphatidylglycerol hydrolase [Pedobacter sp. SYSU D00873]
MRSFHIKLLFLSLVLSFLFSSCTLLFRYRTVNHRGVEKEDFGLPVILYGSSAPTSRKMVLLLSGDGGWLEFNDKLAVEFSKNGYNTLGFNSRTYFWRSRSPEEASRDLTKLIARYARAWNATQIVLAGYSFGADVTPFVYNRLPENLKKRVVAIQLLSPFLSTDFKVHFSDLIGPGKDDRTYKVKNEVAKIRIPVYCFYGEEEEPKSLLGIKRRNFILTLVQGDHEYENAYKQIVNSLNR